jgi:hypothetical protein
VAGPHRSHPSPLKPLKTSRHQERTQVREGSRAYNVKVGSKGEKASVKKRPEEDLGRNVGKIDESPAQTVPCPAPNRYGVILKTTPQPLMQSFKFPPQNVVPYKLPAASRIGASCGELPSLPLKICNILKFDCPPEMAVSS